MARDALQLLNGSELEDVLRQFGPKVAARFRRQGVNRATQEMQRQLKAGARSIKRNGVLVRGIGTRRGRSSRWIGLNKPVPARKKLAGRQGGRGRRTAFGRVKQSSGVPYYYKTLDLASKRGAPLRPWFERKVKSSRANVRREMLNGVRAGIRKEAGRSLTLSRRGYSGRIR